MFLNGNVSTDPSFQHTVQINNVHCKSFIQYQKWIVLPILILCLHFTGYLVAHYVMLQVETVPYKIFIPLLKLLIKIYYIVLCFVSEGKKNKINKKSPNSNKFCWVMLISFDQKSIEENLKKKKSTTNLVDVSYCF